MRGHTETRWTDRAKAWAVVVALLCVPFAVAAFDSSALPGPSGVGGKESGVVPWSLTAFTALGDSNTKGTTGPETGYHWVNVVNTMAGPITTTNLGVDGDQAADLSDDVLPLFPLGRSVYTLMVGSNDQRTYLTDADKLQVYKDALRAHIVYLSTPYTFKTLPTNTTGPHKVTETGAGWAATNAWTGVEYGRSTSTTNDASSFTAYGTTVYVTTITQYNAAAYTETYSITIDGVSQGSFNVAPGNNANITTANGKAYAQRCHRFAGLASGAHTVVVTDTGGASGNVYLEWAAGNHTQAGPYASAFRPRVIVGQVTRQSVAYPYGGSDANVDTYNAVVRTVVGELQSDGLNVVLVNTTDAVDQDTSASGDMNADGIHYKTEGHEKLARVFYAGMTR